MKYIHMMLLIICIWSVALHRVTGQDKSKELAAKQRALQEIMDTLPSCSPLKKQLEAGARGPGIHYAWMDSMRHEGIRQALVYLSIDFNRGGSPPPPQPHHSAFSSALNVLNERDFSLASVERME